MTAPDHPTPAPKPNSQKGVASALGVTTEAVRLWQRLKGAPVGWNVEEWKEWYAKREAGGEDIKVLKKRDLEVSIAIKETKLAREKGKLADIEEVESFIKRAAAKLNVMLAHEMETRLPPTLVGKDIAEMREELRKSSDRIRDAFRRGLLGWQKEVL